VQPTHPHAVSPDEEKENRLATGRSWGILFLAGSCMEPQELKDWCEHRRMVSGRPRILAVDDAPDTQMVLAECLGSDEFCVEVTGSATTARREFLRRRPDAVILDIGLPDASGLDLFDELRTLEPAIPVVFITASESSTLAIEAIRRGAIDFLVKPLDLPVLRRLIGQAIRYRTATEGPTRLAASPSQTTELLVGRSPAMQAVYKSIGRVVNEDVPVLLLGETGTGKELAARAIHQFGPRATRPFLAVNCAAIPESLLESELFGYERGAFTGADRSRPGRFEMCSGGTLLLDEIGELPLHLQAKLLRVLQEKQVNRIGGGASIPIDARIIAATNRNLLDAVDKGAFRADLYYRLHVYPIEIPPLRERREDIPLLVESLLERQRSAAGGSAPRVTAEAMRILRDYSWPGNVRELGAVLQRAALDAAGGVIGVEHLPACLRERPRSFPASTTSVLANLIESRLKLKRPNLYAATMAELERELIRSVLDRTAGNQSAAAAILGITRSSLRFKIRTLGIDVTQFQPQPDTKPESRPPRQLPPIP